MLPTADDPATATVIVNQPTLNDGAGKSDFGQQVQAFVSQMLGRGLAQ
jgi:hypothetical protein